MEVVDTHCHLDEEAYAHERDDVISRAVAVGVTRMISIGTTLAGTRKAIELAQRHPNVWSSIGIHPNYCSQAGPDDWDALVALATERRVVCIGETGLDQYWDYAPLDLQQDYFRRHLALSRQTGLPFVVHCRDAEAGTLAILQEDARLHGPLNGVMHSFAGSQEFANHCLELGMTLSFSGMVTYKRNTALLDVAKTTPLDRILVETDAPYLAPVPQRGNRNEPAYVRYTLGQIADARGMTREDLAAATSANAVKLFRFDDC